MTLRGRTTAVRLSPDNRFSIRSGKGFGDSLYLQGVAREFARLGHVPEVCTSYPDIFRPLAGKVFVSSFRRDRVAKVAHYVNRKRVQGTDQFTDCCINAGLGEGIEFRLDWKPIRVDLIRHNRGSGKPVLAVQLPRSPMGRADGYGDELLPDCKTIQRAIDRLRREFFVIQIGKGAPLHRFNGIDRDFANRTAIGECIDLVYGADAVLGYCSFIAPLAECLDKPALFVWSQRGLRSSNSFVQCITPQKIFNKPSSKAILDDCTEQELIGAVDALCEQVRMPVAV